MKTPTTKAAPRTDCHRIGVLVPTDYVYVMSYIIPEDNAANTGYCFAEARKVCEAIGYGSVKPMHGTIGKCAICGASFRIGDIWQHVPTGDLVHVGHECADKVELTMEAGDRRSLARAQAGIKVARKANKMKATAAERTAKIRAHYCGMYPGLDAVFASDDSRCKSFTKDFDRFDGLSAEDCKNIIAHAAKNSGSK